MSGEGAPLSSRAQPGLLLSEVTWSMVFRETHYCHGAEHLWPAWPPPSSQRGPGSSRPEDVLLFWETHRRLAPGGDTGPEIPGDPPRPRPHQPGSGCLD